MKLCSLFAVAPLLLGGALGACHGTAPAAPSLDATSRTPPPPAAPAAFGPGAIDAALRAEWSKAGITPAPPVDDAGFLRRVYLDLLGTVPPPAAVAEFLSDAAPDKRARLVDRLLASPAYASYWATYWGVDARRVGHEEPGRRSPGAARLARERVRRERLVGQGGDRAPHGDRPEQRRRTAHRRSPRPGSAAADATGDAASGR